MDTISVLQKNKKSNFVGSWELLVIKSLKDCLENGKTPNILKSFNEETMKMNRLLFSIDIKAEKTMIWKALWNEDCYREWAGVFFEGSYAIADNWKEGSKVLFLSPDQSGIYSIIETHIPKKMMMFRHVGIVIKGEEQPVDDETKTWSGATELYLLSEGLNENTLTVEIDVLDEHLDFMTVTFPKALEKVKYLSENL